MVAGRRHPSLIGISNWDPFGESMLSIVRKIEIANQFDRKESAELFGSHGAKTFTTIARINPDNEEALNFTKLFRLTGWSMEDVGASYSGYYRITTDSPCVSFPGCRAVGNRYLHQDIRVCKECSEEGIHLLCHQLPYWKKCPIHFTDLVDKCPSCNNRYGLYSFNKVESSGQFPISSCQYCSETHGHADHHNVSSLSKRKVLTEYREWVKDLTSCLTNKDSSRALFGAINPQRDINKLHALIPGPKWIDKCIFSVQGITVSNVGRFNKNYECAKHDEIYREEQEYLGPKKRLKETCQDLVSIFRDAQHICGLVAAENDISKIPTDWDEVGIYPSSSHSLIYSFNEATKASSTAAYSWSRICGRLLHGNGVTDFDKPDTLSFSIFPWVRHWLDGPGTLAWSKKQDHEWVNKSLVQALSRVWWKHIFEHLFYYLYLRCLLYPNGDMFPANMRIDDIGYEARANGSLPIYLLVQNDEVSTLKYASTMLPRNILNRYVKNELLEAYKYVSKTSRNNITIDNIDRNENIREQSACLSDFLSKIAIMEENRTGHE